MSVIEGNAGRVRRNMEQTMENIVKCQNCIAATDDNKLKARLRVKNERRLSALDKMSSQLGNVKI
jgi:hypothetical protein